MGKNLKNKECGKGIYQRKDGLYSARFVDRIGKRHEKYFKSIPEAKLWLEESKYADKHEDIFVNTDKTVDQWFEFWIENLVGDLAYNTIRNYRERYYQNIQPILGKMAITDVKPMHCKKVLVKMDEDYAGTTIRQTYITMGTMFKAAKMNDIITKHPMDGVRYTKPVRAKNDINALTLQEQRAFLAVAKCSHNYSQYAVLLATGLRAGEMIGLTWDSIDFDKKTLTVSKTLEYRFSEQCWRAGPPKTPESYRTIPLTDQVYDILKELWDNRNTRKEAPALNQILEYMDRKKGTILKFCMRDLVFINYRTGEPTKNTSYDTHLYKLCDKAGIKRISMHDLRHTYATRAIESGMQAKVLQKLLGHSSIKTTMDRYVHVTHESIDDAIQLFQQYNINI